MSHVDTFKVYQDYKKAGYSEEQAICAMSTLDKSFDTVVTQSYLTKELSMLKGEIRSDMAFLVILPIFLAFVFQIVLKKRGLV